MRKKNGSAAYETNIMPVAQLLSVPAEETVAQGDGGDLPLGSGSPVHRWVKPQDHLHPLLCLLDSRAVQSQRPRSWPGTSSRQRFLAVLLRGGQGLSGGPGQQVRAAESRPCPRPACPWGPGRQRHLCRAQASSPRTCSAGHPQLTLRLLCLTLPGNGLRDLIWGPAVAGRT